MRIRTKADWEEKFIVACQEGQLEDIKNLCQNQWMQVADIHANDDDGFRWACFFGHLEVVKYLMTSQELIQAGHTWVGVEAQKNGFQNAYCEGQLNVMKYFLTSTPWSETARPWMSGKDHHWAFRVVCHCKNWDVVRWLVMDYGIDQTPEIEEIMKDYPQAQEYFRVREELSEIQRAIAIEKSNEGTSPPFKDNDGRAAKKAKKL